LKVYPMRKNESGFTFIEIMMAMMILATALVAVYQLQSQSISMATESRFKTSAALLAQSKMTDVEASATLNNRTEEGDFGTDFPQYSWRLAVTDTELSSFKKIEVTVMNKAFVSGGKFTLVLYKASGN
jgi:general secretion pathway protein I